MHRIWKKVDRTIWSRSLTLFAVAVFLDRFGQGLLGGARMNFFVETLGLSNNQILWLEGIREVPGLALIFLAAFTMHLPLAWQGVISLLLMGVGYALQVFVGSYTGLLAMAIIASFGFHLWVPLNHAIGMSLSGKKNTGRILGVLASVGSLAGIVGMAALSLLSKILEALPLGAYFLIGGAFIVFSALFVAKLPMDLGATEVKPARILVKRRYWLYYVLIFLSGARKLVLGSFVTLVLVQNYDMHVWEVSTLMLVSGVLNLLVSPVMGALIDFSGERLTTTASYVILALCCVGYATVSNLWVLLVLWTLIKLVMPLGMGLSTYVYRTAPPEELTPTLTAGVTFDHISSVGVPFLASAALPVIQYSGIFLATAVLILLSIPFAWALQVQAPPVLQMATVAGE
ncbi:MAG TPA: MFS transporter [Chloroflexi bacterium]|nr:MFS transporter [Chloroflexota bacterium]